MKTTFESSWKLSDRSGLSGYLPWLNPSMLTDVISKRNMQPSVPDIQYVLAESTASLA